MVVDLVDRMASTLTYVQIVNQYAHLSELTARLEQVHPLIDEIRVFVVQYAAAPGLTGANADKVYPKYMHLSSSNIGSRRLIGESERNCRAAH